jgi:hypothetical protein
MYGSRSKAPSNNLVHIYIYVYIHVKFLALLGAPYIYDISRLRGNLPEPSGPHRSVMGIIYLFILCIYSPSASMGLKMFSRKDYFAY